jgi:hypothetical protein
MLKHKVTDNWNGRISLNDDGKSVFLPNPDVKREKCHIECNGCQKIYANENICIAYVDPASKWKNHYVREGKIVKNRKTIDAVLNFNPCPLATHVQHAVEEKGSEKHREGQQKQKK